MRLQAVQRKPVERFPQHIPEHIWGEICLYFELGDFIGVTSTPQGRTHQSFFIATTNGRFVVRLIERLNNMVLENEVAVQKQLRKAGIPTSEFIISKTGLLYYRSDAGYVTVCRFLNGAIPEANEDICRRTGVATASYHMVVKMVPYPTKSRTLLTRSRFLRRVRSEADSHRREKLSQLVACMRGVSKRGLPSGICHYDLHLANLLLVDGKVGMLDLENAREGLFILDIARSLVDLSRCPEGVDTHRIKSFLQGYESIRELTGEEKSVLGAAMAYSAGAVAAWFCERRDYDMADHFIDVAQKSLGVAI